MEIGREVRSSHDVRLTDDSKASKRHAAIEVHDSKILIKDLGSKNRTYVNGKQIDVAELRDGDVIRTGGTLFVLRYQPVSQRDAPNSDMEITSRLLGHSTAIGNVRYELSQVARAPTPVLLIASTGSGKELAAEAIHFQSGRKRDALVRVNSAAIAGSLAEKELFGNVAGAFSDARQANEGFFEQANGGSLFLDEVGDMPSELQSKLLRALQPTQQAPFTASRGPTPYPIRIRPVGGKRDVEVNVRIIAATNVDMQRAVAEGRFREDLYQRLHALVVRLPTLSERREDILWLLHHYLNLGCAHADFRTVTAGLGELLLLYSWPGNVRELVSVAQRLIVQVPKAKVLDLANLQSADLNQFRSVPPSRIAPSSSLPEASPAVEEDPESTKPRQEITRELLARLLDENQGNISKIARLLERSQRQIRRRLENFGLRAKPSGPQNEPNRNEDGE